MQSSLQAMPACTAVGLHGTERELSVNVSKTLTSLSHDNRMPEGKSVLVQQGLEEGICWAPFPLHVETEAHLLREKWVFFLFGPRLFSVLKGQKLIRCVRLAVTFWGRQ